MGWLKFPRKNSKYLGVEVPQVTRTDTSSHGRETEVQAMVEAPISAKFLTSFAETSDSGAHQALADAGFSETTGASNSSTANTVLQGEATETRKTEDSLLDDKFLNDISLALQLSDTLGTTSNSLESFADTKQAASGIDRSTARLMYAKDSIYAPKITQEPKSYAPESLQTTTASTSLSTAKPSTQKEQHQPCAHRTKVLDSDVSDSNSEDASSSLDSSISHINHSLPPQTSILERRPFNPAFQSKRRVERWMQTGGGKNNPFSKENQELDMERMKVRHRQEGILAAAQGRGRSSSIHDHGRKARHEGSMYGEIYARRSHSAAGSVRYPRQVNEPPPTPMLVPTSPPLSSVLPMSTPFGARAIMPHHHPVPILMQSPAIPTVEIKPDDVVTVEPEVTPANSISQASKGSVDTTNDKENVAELDNSQEEADERQKGKGREAAEPKGRQSKSKSATKEKSSKPMERKVSRVSTLSSRSSGEGVILTPNDHVMTTKQDDVLQYETSFYPPYYNGSGTSLVYGSVPPSPSAQIHPPVYIIPQAPMPVQYAYQPVSDYHQVSSPVQIHPMSPQFAPGSFAPMSSPPPPVPFLQDDPYAQAYTFRHSAIPQSPSRVSMTTSRSTPTNSPRNARHKMHSYQGASFDDKESARFAPMSPQLRSQPTRRYSGRTSRDSPRL